MQIHSFKSTSSVLVAGALALGFVASPVKAADTINLTAIDGYSLKSMWVREFADFMIPDVNKRLAKDGKYQIKWNQAWGGQIVKPRGVMGGMQKGLGDIGVVTTVFHQDKVPLQMVAYATPFVTTDPRLVSRTIDELADQFAEYRSSFAKFNQVYLTSVAVLDTYQMFSKHPIKTTADFKGDKIGVAGLNARWVEGFGAATVGGSLVGYYNKLKTGVLDTIMLWPEAVVGRSMYEVAPYMLKADLGTVNSKTVTMNSAAWKKLPGAVQDAIKASAIAYRDHTSQKALDVAAASYAAYTAKGGKIHVIDAAERDKWAATIPNIAKGWAAAQDKKGLPGTKVLAAYMDKMRAASQPILRQWDKE